MVFQLLFIVYFFTLYFFISVVCRLRPKIIYSIPSFLYSYVHSFFHFFIHSFACLPGYVYVFIFTHSSSCQNLCLLSRKYVFDFISLSQGLENTTLLGAPHVINTSIGMCDIDIRPVRIITNFLQTVMYYGSSESSCCIQITNPLLSAALQIVRTVISVIYRLSYSLGILRCLC